MIYLKLFLEFFKIGGFSFGGGFSTLPYIFEMAKNTSWISDDYIGNILTVSQVTPGPFACNIGTIVGYKNAGIIGAFLCNLGFVLPAIIIMGIGYKFFYKIKENKKANKVISMIRCSALAGIIGSSVSLFKMSFLKDNNYINLKAIVLGIILYFVLKKKNVNSLILMISSSVISIIFKI